MERQFLDKCKFGFMLKNITVHLMIILTVWRLRYVFKCDSLLATNWYTKGAFHQLRSNLIWITIRGQPIWSTNFCFTNADQIKIAVDLGSDLIAGQSEVKLVDPSFRPSAHALFSGRGRQKSQNCRLGQLETANDLWTGHRRTFQRDSGDHGGAVIGRTWPDITETIAHQTACYPFQTLIIKH